MTLTLRPVLLLALVAAARAAEPVRVLSHVAGPVEVAPPDATHALALHTYWFRGTSWNPREILQALRPIYDILAACDVAVTRLELTTLEGPREFHFYSTAVARELLRAVDAPRPAIFFVQDTRNQPAFDAEAIGLANSRTRPELANTVWVAHGARDLPYAIAHELVHVLSDSGEHSAEPGNLMQPETSPANTHLSTAQCERLRSRGEANGLLERRAVR